MWIRNSAMWLIMAMAAGCSPAQSDEVNTAARPGEKRAMNSDVKSKNSLPKTDAEWKKILTPEQYRVTRKKGTERPFSGEYVKTDKEGTYRCVCCGETLFSSETKFDAHCGWPSFWDPVDKGNLNYVPDHSHGMRRIEVQCKNCGAHLGHVFDDGPHPTGQRYCINSVAIKLQGKDQDGGSSEPAGGKVKAAQKP